MSIKRRTTYGKGLCLVLAALLFFPFVVMAQDAPAVPASDSINQEELDSILAPVALYPDSLLSQILIASTYPLEVVQAERWLKENKGLEGDALTAALEKESWDPSVKSLINFPQVLEMMNAKLDWTQKLGDAVLADQKSVMSTVQSLRAKAEAAGNLKSNEEQTVTVEKETQTIIIESASPQVVYVPTYNPTVIYGPWWWPLHPPYYYYPAWYAPAATPYAFAAGVAVGAAWGYAWSNCNWNNGHVEYNNNQNININNNIDRSKYQGQGQAGDRMQNGQGGKGQWQHDASHRKGVSYRDQSTAQKYKGASSMDTAKARDSYRGYSNQGGQNLSQTSKPSASTRPSASTGASASTRPSASTGASASTRPSGGSVDRSALNNSGSRDSAFGGYGSGKQTSSQSSRGAQSRQSMSSSGRSGSGYSGGGSRSGGGSASRSGGGGGSRGGGGGRGR